MSNNEQSEKFKEAVKRLYEEAASQCSTNQAWEWELKFAEMIISECIRVDILNWDSPPGDAIRKHFGLE